MAVTAVEFTWQQGQAIAKALIDHLDGCFVRVQVAGSIRRQRPICHDIDIVALPLRGIDLFGERSGGMLLDQALQDLGISWNGGPGLHRFEFEGVQVDLYLTDLGHFPLTLLVRTGSAAHNEWLFTRANRWGYSVSYSRGLVHRESGAIQIIKAEQQLFHLLGLEFVEPELREIVGNRPIYL